jgi:hypothetical protein
MRKKLKRFIDYIICACVVFVFLAFWGVALWGTFVVKAPQGPGLLFCMIVMTLISISELLELFD